MQCYKIVFACNVLSSFEALWRPGWWIVLYSVGSAQYFSAELFSCWFRPILKISLVVLKACIRTTTTYFSTWRLALFSRAGPVALNSEFRYSHECTMSYLWLNCVWSCVAHDFEALIDSWNLDLGPSSFSFDFVCSPWVFVPLCSLRGRLVALCSLRPSQFLALFYRKKSMQRAHTSKSLYTS